MTESRSARECIGYVDESDLDLVLVLDANHDGPITRHLLARAGLTPIGAVSASRSTLRCAGTRETDVEISWEGGALLVEDKVDASFTPGQPESYQLEVVERTATGQVAVAVLVFPERNRARYETAAGDAFLYVTCEELAEVAESSGDRLALGAALVLRAAAEPRPGPVSDPVALAWGEGYRAVVGAVTPPGEKVTLGPAIIRTADADWVKLSLIGFPSGADGPWHWFSRGLVSVYVSEEPELSTLPPGAAVVRNKKSWRVDLPVSQVTLERPAADQSGAIDEAVGAAVLLRQWCIGRVASTGPDA